MLRRRAYKLSLAAFVVLTVVWIASGWVGFWYSTGTTTVGIAGGVVVGHLYTHSRAPPSAGFGYNVYPRTMTMLPDLEEVPTVVGPGQQLVIPLWIPALLAGIATIVFGYRSRIIPPGHCKACRYDLTGNVSGVCPECGTSTGDG